MSKASPARFAAVIVEGGRSFDYLVPEELSIKVELGSCVEVFLRGKLKKGYIVSFLESSPFEKIQPIQNILPEESWIPDSIFKLAKWMSEYYCTPFSKVLSSILLRNLRKEVQSKKELWLTLKKSKSEILKCLPALRETHSEQAIVLDAFLQQTKGFFLSDLLREVHLTVSPVKSLLKEKFLESKKICRQSDFLFEEEYFPTKEKELTEEQNKAYESIQESIEKGVFATHLIYGITGSGKTEIYMQAMQRVLEKGKSALVLVPEVALTAQAIERFRARFQDRIAILHHRRSLGERFDSYKSIRSGETRIILGARSALFCPAFNIGLIIVDEEHDTSYKQSEEMPSYHARDVAIMRGKIENAVVVLGSATPSFESYTHALRGKYHLHTLSCRPNASLPKVQIINMNQEFAKAGGFTHFSEGLLSSLKKREELGEQSLLLLNRRGYYTSLLCTSCSYIFKCPNCDTPFTYHKEEATLRCHLCDRVENPLILCPKCNNRTIKYKGFGTEHVERSLKAIFPHIRTLRMDRDTTKKKHAHEELIAEFKAGKADVLIGTQMIAKGLHFPNVTLVGVLNVDGALGIPDFRSSESVFQLLTQVSGRAGRAELEGEVIIQTLMPDNDTIQFAAKQEFPPFYEKEISIRKAFGYPPFSRFMKLIFIGPDAAKTREQAEDFRKKLLPCLSEEQEAFPLTEAGHAKVKGNFRFQFLLRSPKILSLSNTISKMRTEFRFHGKVILFIDVDPIHTFF